MSQSIPKIIIKRPGTVTIPAPPIVSPPEEDEAEDEGGSGEESEAEAEGEAPIELVVDESPSGPIKRPRGRPRGRARGAAPSSPSTRGRGRGRGRPRGSGRGRGSGNRIPRRTDEDGDQDGEANDYLDDREPPYKPSKTVNGVVYDIKGDQLVTEDDPKGDEKIDKWGNLLGGRVFKANTFILPHRHPHRVYMLAIDAARSSGFRDSLYYFRRNPLTHKQNATQSEKDYLIEQGKLGSHLKTRSVTLITARSVFKLHGAKTIKDGRWITDDYYESKVLAEIEEKGIKPGDLVGDLPDPNASTNANDDKHALTLNKSERSGGTKGIYQAGGPTTIFGGSGWGPFSDGPLNAVRKSLLSRDGMTEENYMHQAALRTLDASEKLSQSRSQALTGRTTSEIATTNLGESPIIPAAKSNPVQHPLSYYEPHTGITQYPSSMQPTRSRWESQPDDGSKYVLGGEKTGSAAWGLAWVDVVMEPTLEIPSSEANVQ